MKILNKEFKLKAKQYFNDLGLDTIDWTLSLIRIVFSMFWAYLAIIFTKAFFAWLNYLAGTQQDFSVISWAIGIIIFVVKLPLSRIERITMTYEEFTALEKRCKK